MRPDNRTTQQSSNQGNWATSPAAAGAVSTWDQWLEWLVLRYQNRPFSVPGLGQGRNGPEAKTSDASHKLTVFAGEENFL